MTTITTRAGKGSPLLNSEVDANFTNLNDDKVEASGDSITGDLSFGDNNKAIFGGSQDLQIYHDGSNSYIDDTATGHLFIRSNGDGIYLRSNTNEEIAHFNVNGSVKAYYDNSLKLATTSTGIDVTGSVVSDGLTVDGGSTNNDSSAVAGKFNANGNEHIRLEISTDSTIGNQAALDLISNSITSRLFTTGSGGLVTSVNGSNRMAIATNGDISFYNDAGTSQDLYWDASTSRLGLGTTSPYRTLTVSGDQVVEGLLEVTAATPQILFSVPSGGLDSRIHNDGSGNFIFGTGTNSATPTERMRINSSGNVGIGDTNPARKLTVQGGSGDTLPVRIIGGSGTTTSGLEFQDPSTTADYKVQIGSVGDNLYLRAGGAERMRIDSSGNVLFGATGTATNNYGAKVLKDGSSSEIFAVHRQASDGNLITFARGGTDAGGISYAGGYLNINGQVSGVTASVAGSEQFRVTSTGINVNGDSINAQTSSSYYVRNRVNGGSLNLGVETSAGALYYPITMSGTSNITVFRNATDEIARFLSNGNFGIGTDSATTILEIQDANAQLTIDSELSQFSRVVHQHNGTSVWTTGTRSASDYHIYRESGSGNVIIDQSSLGIGASSPADAITIGNGTSSSQGIGFVSTNTGNNYIHFGDSDSATAGKILYDHANDNVQFYTGGTLRGFYNANGLTVSVNTGGVSQTSHFLTYNENGGELQLYDNNGQAATLLDQSSNATRLLEIQNGSTMQVGLGGSNTTGIIEFRSAGFGLAGVIDASANWVIGKSSIGVGTAGVELRNDGLLAATRSGSNVAVFRRLSSDGTIVDFQKDGATVGSIGNDSNNLYLVFSQANNIGLAGGGPATIFPVGNTGAVRDNAIDLGYSTGRFDDIYATNGTIQTSDRNEKQDIEELTDAEQRVAVACKGLLRKFRWRSAVEEKGDDARIHFGIIAQDLQDAFTAEGLDAGRYGMFINSTWTDEETGEERSRMGVRYSELLAFIISAI